MPLPARNAVFGRIVRVPSVKNYGGKSVTILQLEDETGKLQITWFHMPFLRSTLKRGGVYVFRGRVTAKNGRRNMEHPEIFTAAGYEAVEGQLRPVYPLTAGLTNKMVVKAMTQLLEERQLETEYLPEDQRSRYGLSEINYAVSQIHFG